MANSIPTFEEVSEFHGHECPGLAMGYRIAVAAMDWLQEERSEDEEIVAAPENRSCAVDALQVILGTTLGKGNLIIRDYGKHGYSIYRRSDGRGIRMLFQAPEEWQVHSREERMQAILDAPQDEIISTGPVLEPMPEKAQIEPSVPCAICGEPTMQSALTDVDGKLICGGCIKRPGD